MEIIERNEEHYAATMIAAVDDERLWHYIYILDTKGHESEYHGGSPDRVLISQNSIRYSVKQAEALANCLLAAVEYAKEYIKENE